MSSLARVLPSRPKLALLTTLCLLITVVVPAYAVHDVGVFQLDRNAQTSVQSTVPATDDWDKVCPAGTPPGAVSCIGGISAQATTFDTDGVDASIFTGGGSKDDLNTTSWQWKNGSVPPKDDLAHAYAVRYANGLLYFGADRTANNGDSQIGFWFFQGNVGPQPGGTFGPDAHKNGDILILSDFTNGGTQPTIRIFEYTGTAAGSTDGTLNEIGGGDTENRDCAVISTDDFCASVNNLDGAVAPWLFKNKSGQGTFGHGEFYEGGLNLNTLGLENECFSSFLAETRSSQSVTATLKDFILGGFEACEATVTTTPTNGTTTTDVNSITLGGDIYDHAVIVGTGSNQNPTGTMNFYLCSPAQMTALNETTCVTGGTEINGPTIPNKVTVTPIANTSNSEATSSKATPNAVGTWCWRGEYSGDNRYPAAKDSSTGECFTVTDIASTTTQQSWLPQDQATITSSGGSTIAGSVEFKLYESADCTGDAVQTFSNRPVSASAPYTATTNNSTYYTTAKTISWKATFTSSNSVASGPAGPCETMTVTLDNDITQ